MPVADGLPTTGPTADGAPVGSTSGGGGDSFIVGTYGARVNVAGNYMRVHGEASGPDVGATGLFTDHVPGVNGTLTLITWNKFDADPTATLKVFVDSGFGHVEVDSITMTTQYGAAALSGDVITPTSRVAVQYFSGVAPDFIWAEVHTKVD